MYAGNIGDKTLKINSRKNLAKTYLRAIFLDLKLKNINFNVRIDSHTVGGKYATFRLKWILCKKFMISYKINI